MKARVKATGEIVEVREELDFNVNDNIHPTIDYWTRLEHQYAGMAMQGIMTNLNGFENLRAGVWKLQIETALLASEFAHALVEKMKENEKAMH